MKLFDPVHTAKKENWSNYKKIYVERKKKVKDVKQKNADLKNLNEEKKVIPSIYSLCKYLFYNCIFKSKSDPCFIFYLISATASTQRTHRVIDFQAGHLS